MDIQEKILKREAKIGIIGLGYVGLPLLMQFALAGFPTIGMDNNREKIEMLTTGRSYISDIPDQKIAELNHNFTVKYHTNYEPCQEADAVIICVPTPLDENHNPDLTYLQGAVRGIAEVLKPKAIVVLESTSYPGTTEEVVMPLLSQTGKIPGKDYFLAFSPERTDPGNQTFDLRNTPKLVGGYDQATTGLVKLLYEQIIERVVPVSSIATAEMAKIVENSYRAVNIAFANELAIICNQLSLNVWEVIQAAATKPFGFAPFYPGPGVGGHCIPIDPLYLTWKLKEQNLEFQLVELAAKINALMPEYVVKRVIEGLNQQGKCIKKANLLLLGITYKRDVNDYRESPALEIMERLLTLGARVSYHDPFIDQLTLKDTVYSSVPLTDETIQFYDLLILATDHSSFDYERLAQLANMIIDTRNAFGKYKAQHILVI